MVVRLAFILVALVLGACTSWVDRATQAPASRIDEVSAAASPSAPVAPSPSLVPSASASATLAPSPTQPPDTEGLEVLDLDVFGCPGGVVLDWSPTADEAFHHYTALRSLEPDVATAYPPIAPAVDWGDSYATDPFVTSAVDATLIPSEATFHYRVMAYDARNRPVAASPVRRSRPADVTELEAPAVGAGESGTTRIDWALFGGLGRCFSEYRVLIGPVGGAPLTTLTVISSQSTTEVETVSMRAGESYVVRVEAVRTTTLGGFVVARSETATYTVP